MLVLLGKSGSGKTTVAKELEKRGWEKVKTYTTRPRRVGEGDDYHFISDFDFKEKQARGFFAETTCYETANGTWCYGTVKEGLLNSTKKQVLILNPSGFRQVKPYGVTSIYLVAGDETRLARLRKRGDSEEEIQRRFLTDSIDFEDLGPQVSYLAIADFGTVERVTDMVEFLYSSEL